MTRSSTATAEPSTLINSARVDDTFLEDVIEGLSRPRKRIPSKYFYDHRGSQLFEAICELEAYYPTRTEMTILGAAAADLRELVPADAAVIEFGSGSALKIRVLLEALCTPRLYLPIDISHEHLLTNARSIAAEFPGLRVVPLYHDFTQPLEQDAVARSMPRLGFFPGSTIGNFTPAEARAFLTAAARTLGPGGLFLVGVDLKKDRTILEAAYNDEDGITADFNLNVLTRMNNELGADFVIDRFRHHAFYNAEQGRIEMHLVSDGEQTVVIDGHRFTFEAGETIHTENSYKHSVNDFKALMGEAGFSTVRTWVDAEDLFSVHLCRVEGVSP